MVQASRLLEAFSVFQQAGRLHHKKSHPLRVPSDISLSGKALAAGSTRLGEVVPIAARPTGEPTTHAEQKALAWGTGG